MKTHSLKTIPPYFDHVRLGIKTFEVRKNNRNFETGDYLYLFEYLPDDDTFTGRVCIVKIIYLLKGGCFGISNLYCVMGIELLL